MKTIKSKLEISTLFTYGKRIRSPYVTFLVLQKSQHGQFGRVAFIAGKKNGNAVWRNRAKRRMRAVCRELNFSFAGFDVVFLARSGICDVAYSKLLQTSKHALEKKFNSSENAE